MCVRVLQCVVTASLLLLALFPTAGVGASPGEPLLYPFVSGVDAPGPGERAVSSQPAALAPSPVDQALQSPLQFVENRGQVDSADVAFTFNGDGGALFWTPTGLTMALVSAPEASTASGRSSAPQALGGRLAEPAGQRWVVKLDFLGANPGVRPEGLDPTGATYSYFTGPEDHWRTGIPAYGRIVYRELWPGVDLEFYGEGGRVQRRFLLHEGADPANIRLAYRGASATETLSDGSLRVDTPYGAILEQAPILVSEARGSERAAYRPAQGASEAGEQVYVLDPGAGRAAPPEGPSVANDGQISFIYSGYIGGVGSDQGYGIAVDQTGNAYVTGVAESTAASFPETVGPDPTYNGGYRDAFVAKVRANGSGLVYCGYIGGAEYDGGAGIAVDGAGNAYITGWTYSIQATFPVRVGPDLKYNGSLPATADAFVAKVRADGKMLVYCGYIGGTSDDSGAGIAVDSAGNAYVVGTTGSPQATFPVAVGPDLAYNGGYTDAFIAQVKSDGTALAYCGYIGGSGSDVGNGIAVDASRNAYVVGDTASSQATFPVAGGPDLTYNGGPSDAFVAKVRSGGASLATCGYIGGAGTDTGNGIAVAEDRSAYITGGTNSTQSTFPVGVGPDSVYNGGLSDAYVARVRSNGVSLAFCGYIGGADVDRGMAIAVDGAGDAYVLGDTGSTEATFPVAGGLDLTYNGGILDAFLAKVRGDGTGPIYCGYIGGADEDMGSGIAVDATNYAYVTGWTRSSQAGFPAMVGPDLTYNGGYADAYVAKIGLGNGYVLSGQVLDLTDASVAGVTILTDAGRDAVTDADGAYTITGLFAGNCTITPRKEGYLFWPPTRTAALPANTNSQDFVAYPEVPGVLIIGPEQGTAHIAQQFVAHTWPLTITEPMTYTWSATGLRSVADVEGLEDTQSFTWHTAGQKRVAVTVRTPLGVLTGTHTITILPSKDIFLPLIRK